MIWELYLQRYQWMDTENFTSFEDFKNMATPKEEKPVEEILTDVKDILDTFHQKRG